MSCFHPLKGFKIGSHPSGKPLYKITGYGVEFVRNDNGIWKECYSFIPSDIGSNIVKDYIDIPCGHCIGCLLDRSKQWADRCMLESSYHERNSFITLTYDDLHLPASNEIVDSDGVVFNSPLHPLNKRDFQLFMKRLRERLDNKIRFFACGEYGSKTFRPHYHAIIFGEDFSSDRQLFKENFRGEKYYISELLTSTWNKGHCLVTDISWDTCSYVARYCLKKRHNDMSDFLDSYGLTPEFTLMSRKPGIARQYYDEHKEDIYQNEEIFITDLKGGRKIRPPKYFDKLYDVDYPSDFELIKNNRQEFQKIRKELELSKTDLDYIDYLKAKEYNFHNRTSLLNERSRNETFI